MSKPSMKRPFYLFGIFFLALNAIIALFHDFTLFEVREEVYLLPSITSWFVLMGLISLVSAFIMLKYYHYKKYWFTFSARLLSTLASLFHWIIVFSLLTGGGMNDYYFPLYLAILLSGIIYALSLLFSRAGERFWLRTAGVYLLILGLVLVPTVLGGLYVRDMELYRLLVDIQHWVSIAGDLFPVLISLNFMRELKELEPVNVSGSLLHKSWKVFFVMIGVAALVVSVMFGQNIYQESQKALTSQKGRAKDEARSARPYEARTFVRQEGDELKYRLLKPQNYDPAKKYPMVIHLHGGSGTGTDNVKQIYYGVFSTLLIENRVDYPAFVFVPQCPPNATWGGTTYGRNMEDLLVEAIQALEEEFSIDEKRRYLMGASMGGYGTWHIIASRPEMFAAAVPVCGGGDPGKIPNAVDVPLWAFHGRLDDLVPVRESREMIEALKEAGGNPRYTEYPDKGHDLWRELTNSPELLEWMFAQKRD